MNKPPKEFWIVFAVFGCLVVLLSLITAFGKLSPQTFSVLAILLLTVPFLRFWNLFKVAAKDQPWLETLRTMPYLIEQMKATIRASRMRVATLSALICFGIWETRGGPWAPRLFGFGFLLLLLAGNILSLQQAKRRLEQLNSGE